MRFGKGNVATSSLISRNSRAKEIDTPMLCKGSKKIARARTKLRGESSNKMDPERKGVGIGGGVSKRPSRKCMFLQNVGCAVSQGEGFSNSRYMIGRSPHPPGADLVAHAQDHLPKNLTESMLLFMILAKMLFEDKGEGIAGR